MVGEVKKVNQLAFPSSVTGALVEHRPKMRRSDSYRDGIRRVLEEVYNESFEIQHGKTGAVKIFGCGCRVPHDQKARHFAPRFCKTHEPMLEPELSDCKRMFGPHVIRV